MKTLTAILTCHNRRQTTLSCLEHLHRQQGLSSLRLRVVLVDDGSTDGTAAAVREAFPDVRILHGSGDLYWAGGMRLGFAAARAVGADYYLWLNDDTQLRPDALRRLFDALEEVDDSEEPEAIIVGTTADPETGRPTYGGRVRCSWWHPLKYTLVQAASNPTPCEVMNGNCVLIPNAAARTVGGIDPHFTHAIADFDYAMRARRLGIDIWVAPGIVGTCAKNDPSGSWEDAHLSLRERWARMQGPKGLPVREWATYARRYAGPLWPLYAPLPVVRLLFSALPTK